MSARPTISAKKSNRLIKGKKIQQAVLGESAFIDDLTDAHDTDLAPNHDPSHPSNSLPDSAVALPSRSWLSLRTKASKHSPTDYSVDTIDSPIDESRDGLHPPNMFRDRFARVSPPAKEEDGRDSYLTANGSAISVNRTPVPSASQGIDVEAAINLLQELRKTASPEELVALHRALLPTKQIPTIASPENVDSDSLQNRADSTSRRRSTLLPGLATRGGTDGDLLRKPGDEFLSAKTPTYAISPSIYSPSPAENAPIKGAFTFDDQRPRTPASTNYIPAGAYRHGTLRITNGAASPASSMHGRSSFELHDTYDDEASRIAASNDMLEEQLNQYSAIRAQMRHSVISTMGSPTTANFRIPEREEKPRATPTISVSKPAPRNRVRSNSNAAMMEYDEFSGSPFSPQVETTPQPAVIEPSVVVELVEPPKAKSALPIQEAYFVESPEELHSQASPSSMDDPRLRPTKPLHADSGYGSEASTDPPSAVEPTDKDSSELPAPTLLSIPKSPDSDTRTSRAKTVSAQPSLYTFEQVMAAQPDFFDDTVSQHHADGESETTEPSRPRSRHRSLFKSLKSRKSKENMQAYKEATSPETKKSTRSLVSSVTNLETPVPEAPSKKSKPKKLKKNVPSHVKEARKELKKLEETARVQAAEEEEAARKEANRKSQAIVPTAASEEPDALPVPPERRFSLTRMRGSTIMRTKDENRKSVAMTLPARSSSYQNVAIPHAASTNEEDDSEVEERPVTRGMDDETASRVARQRSRDYSDMPKIDYSALPQQAPRQPAGMPTRTPPPIPEAQHDPVHRSPRSDFLRLHKYQDSSSPESMRTEVREMIAERRRQELELLGVDPAADMPAMAYSVATSKQSPPTRKPTTPDQTADAASWDAQAKIWRERRQSLGKTLKQASKPEPSRNAVSNSQQLAVNTHRGSRPLGPRSFAPQRLSVVEEALSPISPMDVNIDLGFGSMTNQHVSPVSTIAHSPYDFQEFSYVSAANFPEPDQEPFYSAPHMTSSSNAIHRHQSRPSDESISSRPKSACLSIPDRYSGGLQYEWHRDTGFGGSAGTRTSGHEGAERSKPSKMAYGLDLSEFNLHDQHDAMLTFGS